MQRQKKNKSLVAKKFYLFREAEKGSHATHATQFFDFESQLPAHFIKSDSRGTHPSSTVLTLTRALMMIFHPFIKMCVAEISKDASLAHRNHHHLKRARPRGLIVLRTFYKVKIECKRLLYMEKR